MKGCDPIEVVRALRLVGYDRIVSIKHKDSLMSAREGREKVARTLSEVAIREQPGALWWA